MTPDMIIINGRVLTMDNANPRAAAVAIAAGRIAAVGSNAEIAAMAGAQTRRIDAGGRTVLPGFVESHLHIVLGGVELT
ncbi:MAG: amidohydrolase family protein, partial [Paracoccaceae bacterium]|nr:amidohydrolase family protein [Paracoccaceae bacterium]